MSRGCEVNKIMSKLTKLFLVLGVGFSILGILLNAGVIHTGDLAVLYVVLPLGATFLGLFLIWRMMQSETARYDTEHPGRH